MKTALITGLISLTIVSGFAQGSRDRLIYQKLQLLALSEHDTVLTGTYSVYENRATNQGRKIDLNIVVIPALHPDNRAPVFFIEGGPGVGAANSFNISLYADSTFGYRLYHDVVLIDIRGTGRSNPLHCLSLQTKQTMQDQFDDMYPPDAVKECYTELSKRADLTQYTTENVVKDLEDVRQYLGYGKINIFGLSYGTRVCLVYIKMFPESIESCVLWSPTSTYSHMPLQFARDAQNSLDSLFKQCRKDSACHASFPLIENEFKLLQERGKEGPFNVDYSGSNGSEIHLKISWNAIATNLRRTMYTPYGLRTLPFIIHQLYLGNFEPFLASFPEAADTNFFIAEGLYLCITCSEDVPFIKAAEVQTSVQGTFMGDYRISQQQSACKNWVQGKITADYFDPVTSSVPTLVFSGGLDPVTPPSMAEEIKSHLSNCQHIVIPAMSHTFDGLNNIECFDRLVVEFINHPSTHLNTDCITGMTPPDFKVK